MSPKVEVFLACVPMLLFVLTTTSTFTNAWILTVSSRSVALQSATALQRRLFASARFMSSSSTEEEKAISSSSATATAVGQPEIPYDYDVPDDAVINIKPKAMRRLRELRDQQQRQNGKEGDLILRMGVRSGGCSGMSYVMDFSTADAIHDDDAVDEYPGERIRCVVDAKSLLYLYGLELDYSDELIGGGFKFSNPNAEESCGCGSSFGV